MKEKRPRNKLVPQGRYKHLLFHKGMVVALQAVGKEAQRKKKVKVKGSKIDRNGSV